MSTYAIGDLQGCHDEFLALLSALRFDPARDRALLTGDLVNRGPKSLEALRYVRSLGRAAVTVLGNHDLHLLAVAEGGKPGSRDTLDGILHAPDRDELLDWLAQQPLAWDDPETGVLLVHAGLPPQWSRRRTLDLAAEAAALIAGPKRRKFLARMYGNEPDRWDESLEGMDRHRFVINCLTRMRYCTADGRIDLRHKGAPGSQPPELLPWFEVPGRATEGERIVFGHWSTLGRVNWESSQVYGLDTGCVWGASLSALNLDSGELTRVGCEAHRSPGAEAD